MGFLVWVAGFSWLHRQTCKLLPDRDAYILPTAALLTGWGLLTNWRLGTAYGIKQTIWLVVSMGIFWMGIRIPRLLDHLQRYKYLWLTGGLILTALTFIFGVYPGGSGPRLWLGCCGFYLQPSEPLKLLLIIYLAAYLADRLRMQFRLLHILTPTLVLVGAAIALLLAQRDLGTASIFIGLYFSIVFLASGRRRILAIGGISVVIASILGYLLFDVIRLRVDAWLNPWSDPSGRSYQVVQSLLAVSTGGVFGSGPGLGSPGVVPVVQSDFIFSAIAEETGLIGVIGLLALFALLVQRGWQIALRSNNSYRRYLAVGLTIYIALQSILIMCGNTRLLPLTGVTLPFMSYGGSSLLTAYLSILLLSLACNQREEEPLPVKHLFPYSLTGGLLFACFAAIALATGWWALVRNQSLQARYDNPRRTITDRYVMRGSLVDRNNLPLSYTSGQPGNYQREMAYVPLSTTLGYTSPVFGQAGLEAALDDYLRGLEGNPASMVVFTRLLYAQPPPGLNVRLSIDLGNQERADELLGEHAGALVLLNAASGEILALASHPYFDPAELDQFGLEWMQDPSAPLLNRAAQGLYPPGTTLVPFYLASLLSTGTLPVLPDKMTTYLDGKYWPCTNNIEITDWTSAISSACPEAVFRLAEQFDSDKLSGLFQDLGFYEGLQLPLDTTAPPDNVAILEDFRESALGQGNLAVNPIQMALAAATLSADGELPGPGLALAVQTPTQGWVVLPGISPSSALPPQGARQAASMLALSDLPVWRVVASAFREQGQITWCIAGTLPDWRGTPLALALVLEEYNPSLAGQICREMLAGVLNQ